MASLKARYFMLYEFTHGKRPDFILDHINKALEEHEKIDLKTCQHWFQRFRNGILSVDDDAIKKITWKATPPADVFYDIFVFLNWIEVAKCQLLSLHFHTMIMEGHEKLPLYYIESVSFYNRYNGLNREICIENKDVIKSFPIDELDNDVIRSLNYCVINYITIFIDNDVEDADSLRKTFAVTQMPLNAIECSFLNKQEDLGRFKEILDNYVSASKIVFHFNEGNLQNYLKNISNLQLPSAVEKIQIIVDDDNEFLNDENYDDLRRFIYEQPFGRRCVLLEQFPSTISFLDVLVLPYISIFMEIEDLNKLLRKIRINFIVFEEGELETFLRQLRQKRIVMIEDGRRSEDKKDILVTKKNITVEYKGIVHREKFKLNVLIKKWVDTDNPQRVGYEVLVRIDEITD